MGNFIAWDARTGKIARSVKEQFSVWSGALATAGGAMQLLQAGVDCSVEGSHENDEVRASLWRPREGA
jgi:hypothetical protein